MAMADDTSLVRETLAGNTGSFEVLVDRYYHVVVNLAYRVVNDTEEARDVAQTTFLKAFEKLPTYDPSYPFFSWMYRIGFNQALNTVRRRKPLEPLADEMRSPLPRPDEDYERGKLSDDIGAALMRLSLDHRLVVVLRHFVGMSYAEMANVLSLPEKTVKSRLFSARRQLCTLLIDRSPAQ
jgi:RNA polymerase sigma-70 factor (ECF subfamily)